MSREIETYPIEPELRRPMLRKPDLVEGDAYPVRDERGWIVYDQDGRVVHGD